MLPLQISRREEEKVQRHWVVTHEGQVTLSSGIQRWTVLYSGQYRIEAVGAARGYGVLTICQNKPVGTSVE